MEDTSRSQADFSTRPSALVEMTTPGGLSQNPPTNMTCTRGHFLESVIDAGAALSYYLEQDNREIR